MAYIDSAQFATDGTFRERVKVALLKCAVIVQAEADTVPSHADRSKLAARVLRDPNKWADLFARAGTAVNDMTSAASPADAALLAGITALWNAFALNAPAEG